MRACVSYRYVVRRCLLQKQLAVLKEKVIWKEAEATLRGNLKHLDVVAAQQVQFAQAWNNHIRFSNEDVVDEHAK